MAGPLSPNARARSLANDFGPTRGANSPDSFLLALYDDHPEFGGVELDSTSCPGYARPTVDNDDFAPVDGGVRVSVAMADATAAWTQIAKYALLLDSADDTEGWDFGPLDQIRIRTAGAIDPLILTIFYDDDSTQP